MTAAPTLTYLVAHPAAVRIGVDRPAALLGLLALVLFFRFPFRRRAGRTDSPWAAAALRAAAFACLVGALAGLHVSVRVPDDHLTIVAAVDLSDSIDADGREWERRYLAELDARLPPGDDLAVIAFAGDAALLRSPGSRTPLQPWQPLATSGATDLSRAIGAAMALFPDGGAHRLLLLTDGNETRGDVGRQLPWLRSAHVRIDAAVPPQRQAADVRLDKVIAPPLVGMDAAVPIRVIAQNHGRLRAAVLNLYLDDVIADSSAVELQPGRNALTLTTQFGDTGSHRLRAELAVDGDPSPANNTRDVGITIRGRTRVLVLTPRPQSVIADALTRKGLTAIVQPANAPITLAALLSHHAVVLEDVTAADLAKPTADVLDTYVAEYGGGLIVAGGAGTFGDPELSHTALRRLLPVTLEPHRPRQGSREPLALFLVIDRSNSMGYNSRIGTLRDGEKLRYAKEAALAVIRQLKDQDRVGVIAFDSQPHEIAPLAALRDTRQQLEDMIPRLVENGGTDFYDALVLAREQLIASRVNRRHIILLTDGDTNRAAPGEYRALTHDLSADKISVTTIRIGDNTVNLKLLKDISSETGGEFHYVQDAEMLPELMLRETTRALSPGTGTEQYFPRLGAPTQALQGIDEPQLPPLGAYAYAQPKDGAETLLQVTRLERRDPLLAAWQYGLGRVAAFTASPTDDAEEWMHWAELTKFWSQLVHWTAREHTDDEVAIDARRVDGAAEILIRTFGPTADGAALFGRLQVDDTTSRNLELTAREPRTFSATVLDLPAGRYPLTLVKRTASGAVSQQTQLVTIPQVDEGSDGELAAATPNIALLTQITAATGGTMNPPARALTDRPLGTAAAAYALDWLFLPLGMALFLADTALRKLYDGALPAWYTRRAVARR
jgi:Ca-activated chloride channel family protein